eukprot:4843869-Karenia_brevis.AAC.1
MEVPNEWRRSQVACLFKKGDATCPENYRPISLLQIGYKIFSKLILNRLVKGGIENILWETQFGFRPGMGTQGAIFIARRLIERCFNFEHHHITFLALDWARAFDSIDPA